MKEQPLDCTAPIDAVITWVDGNDPYHKASRELHMGRQDSPLSENAVNPHRWACNGEINYCLQSIGKHAPWVRNIYLVTNNKLPDLGNLKRSVKDKIIMQSHSDLFYGFEHVLPTFNSLSIETMLWRIKGLSENFLYYNDDVFIVGNLSPEEMFAPTGPFLRGGWEDLSDMMKNDNSKASPELFNIWMQVNAAQLCGYGSQKIFVSAHCAFALKKNIFSDFFSYKKLSMESNINHKFRNINQFNPISLHDHRCLYLGKGCIKNKKDYIHIHSGAGLGDDDTPVRDYLMKASEPDIKFLCVNDLPQVEKVVPDARELIINAIS